MRRAAASAAALVLLAVLFRLGKREPAPASFSVTLPPPDAPRRRPASPSSPAPGPRADAAARAAAADSPPQPAAPGTASASRAPAAPADDKESLLNEVLRSSDDNDPRLDGSFNGLPLETRRRFREKYREFPPESLNQRGTIVYLLGRNLAAPEDWAFLREVAGGPPCLSLADCAKADPGGDGSDDPGAAVTLAYPALVALKQAERVLAEGGSARREALAVVRAGLGSRIPAVAEAAARIEGRF